MILSIPVFIAFCVAVLGLRSLRPSSLLFLWPFLLLVAPPARAVFGPIPIYVYDVLGLVMFSLVIERWRHQPWPPGVAPWGLWIFAALAAFGTFAPMWRYGVHPEMLWNLGHSGIAFGVVLIGAALVRVATPNERLAFCWGLAAGLCVLAVVALLQWTSLTWSQFFFKIYYANIDRGDVLRSAGLAKSFASRAIGPFGSPNTFAVVALVAALNCWLFSGASRSRVVIVAAMAATLIIFTTTSRQALIGAAIIGVGYMLVSPLARSLPRLALGAVVALPVIVLFGADAWTNRLSRLSEGVGEDNVNARLVVGPQRLWAMYEKDPSFLFTGVGLEVQKLARYGIVSVSDALQGFVSNGFLLYLYYLGIVGFALMLAFWWNLLRVGAKTPQLVRGICFGGVLGMIFVVFSDNHAFMAEELVTLIMTFCGGVFALAAANTAQTPSRVASRRVRR